MNHIWIEILIVFVLTLLNGFFVLSEIALISVRKTRIAELVKAGNTRAKIVQQLHQNPERLFATTQVGVSLITIFASAFAGASIAEKLVRYVDYINIPFVQQYSYNISFIVVVVAVAVLSLIVGELVPKSLGLRNAENFSLISAYPIWFLSKVFSWLITFLEFCSNIILKPFNDSTTFAEGRLSEEEIRSLIAEGRKVGTIEAHEHNIIENVFNFSDLGVSKIMVPRANMTAYDISETAAEIISKAIDSGYSRLPMYQGDFNSMIGVLYTKKLLTSLGENPDQLDLRTFLVPPLFVPDTMKIRRVLKLLQGKKSHMALVTDEHGQIAGLVTLEDILEEIVGEIADETDEVLETIKKSGDDYLVAGNVSVVDFNKYFSLQLPEDEDYTTVSGFILEKLEHFPNPGETVDYQGAQFVVRESADRTIKIVLVQGVKPAK